MYNVGHNERNGANSLSKETVQLPVFKLMLHKQSDLIHTKLFV